MKFTKMHGIGNDYVYINCFRERVENPEELSIRVSDRHFGIGSDGLILIKPSKVADCEMAMYNADGSRSEMCGNGIRCVGKYVYENGIVKKKTVTVETLAGIKTLDLLVDKASGKVDMVTVNMGKPIFVPGQIPVLLEENPVKAVPIIIDQKEYQVTCLSMGNPHAVVFTENIKELDLESLGPKFENYKKFPNRINTEFVEKKDNAHLKMRVWERGSGETLACGTGACASVVAAIINGYTGRKVEIELLGGKLGIFWNPEDNCVYMTGPAETVFTGELF
ncbi:MAG: diaminopimelate epimerase [Lachnospiraceae bacterium]|nr:diaminopimelate epimerase [Lachnospiraceae bacterium]